MAISVSNLARSIEFYSEVLGFELQRIIDAPPERRLGDIVGLLGCSARIAHLHPADGTPFMLELFEYGDPVGRPMASERNQADIGISHIGFTSSDARGDYLRFQELNVVCLSEPVEFRPGVWLFYFRGPDSEVCEFRET